MRVVSRFAAAAFAASAATSFAAPPAGDAAQVVRDLYSAHRPWAEVELDLADAEVRARYFCAGLQQAFTHNTQLAAACPEGELCGLDFDPILSAQDFGDGDGFALRIEAMPPPARDVHAAHFHLFGASGEETVVHFHLARNGAAWCVDDIVYPGLDGLSLKGHLDSVR